MCIRKKVRPTQVPKLSSPEPTTIHVFLCLLPEMFHTYRGPVICSIHIEALLLLTKYNLEYIILLFSFGNLSWILFSYFIYGYIFKTIVA